MNGRLTQEDFDILRGFADKGDRYDYWSYLLKCGDPYAGLALGVVTNETLAGYIANHFTMESARAANLPMDDALMNRIGVGLMRADFNVRESLFENGAEDGGLNLKVEVIAAYHGDVLSKETGGALDIRAWTAYELLRRYLEQGEKTGDYSEANAIWKSFIEDSHNLAAMTLDSIEARFGYDAASWYERNIMATVEFGSEQIFSPENLYSNRNISHIDGWDYDSDSGRWLQVVRIGDPPLLDILPLDDDGMAVVYADRATSLALEQSRDLRIHMMGGVGNTISITRFKVRPEYQKYDLNDPNQRRLINEITGNRFGETASKPQPSAQPVSPSAASARPQRSGGGIPAPGASVRGATAGSSRQPEQDRVRPPAGASGPRPASSPAGGGGPAGFRAVPGGAPRGPVAMSMSRTLPESGLSGASATTASPPIGVPFAARAAGSAAGPDVFGAAASLSDATVVPEPASAPPPVAEAGEGPTPTSYKRGRYDTSPPRWGYDIRRQPDGRWTCQALDEPPPDFPAHEIPPLPPYPPPQPAATPAPLSPGQQRAALPADDNMLTPREPSKETAAVRIGDHVHKFGTVTVLADGSLKVWWDEDAVYRSVMERLNRDLERPATGPRGFNGRTTPVYASTYNPFGLRRG